MRLLICPERFVDEGPRGYQLRVAEANLLPPSLTYLVEEWGDDFDGRAMCDADAGTRVHQRARYCPGCLARSGYWRLGWELLFSDACSVCGCWLVDTCGACGHALGWRRDSLTRCGCGASLVTQESSAAPPVLAMLSRVLEQRALGLSTVELPGMRQMSSAQCARLVRLLGAYGVLNGQRRPQKVMRAGSLEASWPISSYAAEVLCNWPAGFHAMLDQLRRDARADEQGRMGRAFGGFYRALYVACRDAQFNWVRDAFEDYVAAHWTGAIGRRNRRLPSSVLDRVAWLPGQAAARQLGVSMRRLELLIGSGQLAAAERTVKSGRRYLLVRRADIESLQVGSGVEMTLAEAATGLGIKRQRLARLLPTLCPRAVKAAERGAVWAIPRAWVEKLQLMLADLPICEVDVETQVSLDRVLRYSFCSDPQLASLLADFASGKLRPVGRVSGRRGLTSMVLKRSEVVRYEVDPDDRERTWITVQEAAEVLNIKQEVAYDLSRLQLLKTHFRQIGRRKVGCVQCAELEAFRLKFVFARDIAKAVGRSSRGVMQSLTALGIHPVAGPEINKCRQVMFLRVALDGLEKFELFAR